MTDCFQTRAVFHLFWPSGMNAVWADGSGVGGLVDGYADEGDTISYTFTVRCTHTQRGRTQY